MATQRIKIKFHTIHTLWEFAQQIKSVNIEVNTKETTLICDCDEPEIIPAIEKYHGHIIQEHHPL